MDVLDKTVVLTFDDGNKSDLYFVAPLLKKYGFGATFFVNDAINTQKYLTWNEIKELHNLGFEIGNHTGSHKLFRIGPSARQQFIKEVEVIEGRCEEYGIPRPTSFCYCSYRHTKTAVQVLQSKGYKFARRGVAPEFKCTDLGDRGPVYDVTKHHNLLIPSTGVSGPNWNFDDFLWALNQGKTPILTFHGVPDCHENVSTKKESFVRFMKHLHDHQYHVISLYALLYFIGEK